MPERPRLPQARLPRPERPSRAWLLVSLLFHGVLVVSLIWPGLLDPPDGGAVGEAGQRGGGGGGHSRVTEIQLPAYQRVAAARPPVAVATVPREIPPPVLQPPVEEQVIEQRPVVAETIATGAEVADSGVGPGENPDAGVGPGRGGGVGTGLGTGVGSDTGMARGGDRGEIFPPRARYSILPPLPQPASVRGRSFQVRFWVDVDGRVRKVDVEPQIKDGSYRQKFLSLMYEYTFEPARRADGTKVDGEAVITITL